MAGISATIRQAVQEHLDSGASLNSLAKRAGITHAALHRWWHQERDARASTLDALANALGVTARQSKQAPKSGQTTADKIAQIPVEKLRLKELIYGQNTGQAPTTETKPADLFSPPTYLR